MPNVYSCNVTIFWTMKTSLTMMMKTVALLLVAFTSVDGMCPSQCDCLNRTVICHGESWPEKMIFRYIYWLRRLILHMKSIFNIQSNCSCLIYKFIFMSIHFPYSMNIDCHNIFPSILWKYEWRVSLWYCFIHILYKFLFHD